MTPPAPPPDRWATSTPAARRRWAARGLGLLLITAQLVAHAFLADITATPRAMYLQVGAGAFTGGNGTFYYGGTPGNNTTINSVSASVAASSLGNGTPVVFSTNSTVSNSPYEGYANYCVPSTGQVYIGGFYRAGSQSGSATLSVSTPLNLTSGANTVAFSTISWTSSGLSDGTPTLPAGTFAGGSSQVLRSGIVNQWFESCFTFSYANAALVPAGTFTGRATYTLSAP